MEYVYSMYTYDGKTYCERFKVVTETDKTYTCITKNGYPHKYLKKYLDIVFLDNYSIGVRSSSFEKCKEILNNYINNLLDNINKFNIEKVKDMK